MKIYLIVLISIVILLWSYFFLFKPMIERMSFNQIIKDSFEAFKDDSKDNSICKRCIFAFYIFPILVGITLSIFVGITKNQINTILTIFAIFIGLLFNLLLLVLEIIHKSKTNLNNLIDNQNEKKDFTLKKSILKLKCKLSKEIFYSISFTILISIFIVLISFISSIDFSFLPKKIYIVLKQIAGSLIYSLVLIFVASLFVILKRIHEVLKNEINSTKP